MAEHLEIPFAQAALADLHLDGIYKGGTRGNRGDDPLPLLLGCGNAGGFRLRKPTVKNAPAQYAFAVLFTFGDHTDWPDYLDPETGLFVYYGDNRQAGEDIHIPKGNRLLRNAFDALHGAPPHRLAIPPFLIFSRGPHGSDVVFRGLAVPGGDGVAPTDDLVAIWKSGVSPDKGLRRFQNYRAVFTILQESMVKRAWIDDLVGGDPLSTNCPPAWRKWVESGKYNPLLAPRTVAFRTREEQIPTGVELAVVERIRSYFEDDPYDFERCAILLASYADPNIMPSSIQLTRRTADGGRDAIGQYRIGSQLNEHAISVEFALEAKCYSIQQPVRVEHTSRLISRLRHRQFGILVTSSFVHHQAYKEIVEDGHPVLVMAAKDIARVLAQKGYGTPEAVGQWLVDHFS